MDEVAADLRLGFAAGHFYGLAAFAALIINETTHRICDVIDQTRTKQNTKQAPRPECDQLPAEFHFIIEFHIVIKAPVSYVVVRNCC